VLDADTDRADLELRLIGPGDDPERPVRKQPQQLECLVQRAIIHVSISSGVVKITGIAFGWMTSTSAFGSVVRNAKMSLVVSPLTFLTDVQLVQMAAKQARGRLSSRANQMSSPSALFQEALNGRPVTWLEKVSGEQYQKVRFKSFA
jgi:hypothetical protein